MRQLFISYARENKSDIEALARDLDALGYQAWFDSALRGGQSWWDEILRRIVDSDAFVAVVSDQTLNSVACKRELAWALALGKPVLPLAVQRLPEALPNALSTRQIIGYSPSARESAIALAGALANLPAAPPLPQPLPEAPPIPLSYLSGLVDLVAQSEPLTHDQQHQILIDLEPALRSTDEEERRAGRYVLEMFGKRNDLYADVDHGLRRLQGTNTSPDETQAAEPVGDRKTVPAPRDGARRIGLGAAALAVIAAAVIAVVLITRGGGDDGPGTRVAEETPTATTSPAMSTPTDTPTATSPSRSPTQPPNGATTSFTSPTGNIGCVIDASLVRCDIRRRNWLPPRRPSDCPPATEYGQGIMLSPDRGAEFVCADDTAFGGGEPLAYGDSIAAGDLNCTSSEAGISCVHGRSGNGFAISREGYEIF